MKSLTPFDFAQKYFSIITFVVTRRVGFLHTVRKELKKNASTFPFYFLPVFSAYRITTGIVSIFFYSEVMGSTFFSNQAILAKGVVMGVGVGWRPRPLHFKIIMVTKTKAL